MKGTRTTIAVLVTVMLLAAVLVPGGTLHLAVLPVVLLVLPLTLTLTRRWTEAESSPFETLDRSLLLLRAPPASSIKR
jgi:hypothetical protein